MNVEGFSARQEEVVSRHPRRMALTRGAYRRACWPACPLLWRGMFASTEIGALKVTAARARR